MLRPWPGAFVALTIMLLVPTSASAAGTDIWTNWVASPDEATIRSLDFIGPKLVGASEDDGVFTSPAVNGPWTQQNSGLTAPGADSVRQVVSNSGNLYAATSAGLFRSAGGTGAWTQIGIGDPPRRLNQGGIQSIVFNSATDMVVAVAGASPSGIFYSSDSGDHWDRASGLPSVEAVFHLAAGPGGSPIYAASQDGVFASVNQGRSWSLASDGIPPSESTFRVAVDPANPTHLYASTSSSVYRSYTGGATWVEAAGGTLPAAGAKQAFLLAPALGGQFGVGHALVGTTKGVYATVDDGSTWGAMSPDVVAGAALEMANRIVWSLGLGFSPPSLMAGTQGFGIYSLPMTPVDDPASFSVTPNSGLTVGKTMTAPTAAWGGTLPLFFTYQWKRCTTAACTPTTSIAGAVGGTYTISSTDVDPDTRFAVTVCAINIVSPSAVCKTSNPTTAGVAGPPDAAPKPLSGQAVSPTGASFPWGQTFTINPGTWRTEASASQITPDSFTFRWQRCFSANCSAIPGASGASYTSTTADVGGTLRAFVGATKGGVASQLYLAGTTLTLIEKTPVNTEKPKVIGDPYTGSVLTSTAGAWDAHDPTYTRRWFRCEADGLGCNPIVATETAATHTVTAADLGKRLQIEITATQEDPSQDRVTKAYSDPSPVITDPPAATPPPPPSGGPPPSGDTPPVITPPALPVLGAITLSARTLTAKKPLTLTIASSAAGTLRIVLQRLRPGRKVGKQCKPPSHKLRKKPKCTRATTVARLTRALVAGSTKIKIARKIGKKLLPVGRYRAVLTPFSAAGAKGKPKRVLFRVKRG